MKIINKIFEGIKIEIDQNSYGGEYVKMEYDSRQIENGDIFVALKGENDDGHKYINSAIQRGARLIVVSQKIEVKDSGINIVRVENTRKILGRLAGNFYGNPEKKLKILGVTGTNGKTTTAYLLHKFLKNSAFIGSIGIKIGKKNYPPVNTTPESLDIIKYAKETLEGGGKYLILEVSSQGIDNFRIEGLRFTGAIFTNLSKEHLEYHKNMEEYYLVKERLFNQVKEDGIIVTSIENSYGRRLKERYKDAVTYGYDRGDYRGEIIDLKLDWMKARIEGVKGLSTIETSLIGDYNLLNILAATAMVEKLCEDNKGLPEKLKKLNFIEGRMQIIEERGIKAIVDYAHTEDALESVLKTLTKCNYKKLYTLISGTGERYSEKRPRLAEISEKYSDYTMVSSNSPRNEDPMEIALEVAAGFKNARYSTYDIEVDRIKAIRKLVAQAQSGDIILLTGKGHENYQEIKGEKKEYREIEVVKKALQ
ncbi:MULTISPECIES: UDP-N-acetylmuramoyl-L-alanyl-D-glutamate--2,6-diaminopimelate ligase [Psychrilyobacter]|nr:MULTISPECIES: UDP-N-acetylmuramoyl-L-alanyl-D-glutamate--2,6-diaminopimelate ligase [Psychrilyobacter]MCS5421381.1 UDP-N-acetylmuramoyl-L-alanyl-D-glutamate--2,6-diaminopimelate ligase [Psychrilyobacter sp. S5]NDI78467.1 UDP-N-acetylmuramoyl-L-alanyl-D-glutamate--2,6-diaminopimelate ligase [Psychrilyobacter piezotolerans]